MDDSLPDLDWLGVPDRTCARQPAREMLCGFQSRRKFVKTPMSWTRYLFVPHPQEACFELPGQTKRCQVASNPETLQKIKKRCEFKLLQTSSSSSHVRLWLLNLLWFLPRFAAGNERAQRAWVVFPRSMLVCMFSLLCSSDSTGVGSEEYIQLKSHHKNNLSAALFSLFTVVLDVDKGPLCTFAMTPRITNTCKQFLPLLADRGWTSDTCFRKASVNPFASRHSPWTLSSPCKADLGGSGFFTCLMKSSF